ncbi:DUF192 domain-containing protein [Haladaptatus salinisoli]|uniref:DUF192 domain-containing protein n=1 Tax=Haladaptatus salinisoli TaxID=2884876 RepID=UPI001D0AB8B1|nr:DUF192 domain-containing protein [Haladaptatus salinisoli]
MRVVHRRNETERTLVPRVESVDTLRSRVAGLVRLARRDEHALLFSFESEGERRASTLLTPLSLDVVWTTEGRVTRVARLDAWRGFERGRGDRVFEFRAGVAGGVEPGDELAVRQPQSSRSMV